VREKAQQWAYDSWSSDVEEDSLSTSPRSPRSRGDVAEQEVCDDEDEDKSNARGAREAEDDADDAEATAVCQRVHILGELSKEAAVQVLLGHCCSLNPPREYVNSPPRSSMTGGEEPDQEAHSLAAKPVETSACGVGRCSALFSLADPHRNARVAGAKKCKKYFHSLVATFMASHRVYGYFNGALVLTAVALVQLPRRVMRKKNRTIGDRSDSPMSPGSRIRVNSPSLDYPISKAARAMLRLAVGLAPVAHLKEEHHQVATLHQKQLQGVVEGSYAIVHHLACIPGCQGDLKSLLEELARHKLASVDAFAVVEIDSCEAVACKEVGFISLSEDRIRYPGRSITVKSMWYSN
jgi:hypothetical protein